MSKGSMTPKIFLMNILNAVGAGVVIALLPNALLGELLKLFKDGYPTLQTIYEIVVVIQSFMPFIIGVLAAHQFKFSGAGATMIGTSAMIGSGVIKVTGTSFNMSGVGDIINVIVVVIITCALYMLLQNKLGSLEMIILPVLIPVIGG